MLPLTANSEDTPGQTTYVLAARVGAMWSVILASVFPVTEYASDHNSETRSIDLFNAAHAEAGFHLAPLVCEPAIRQTEPQPENGAIMMLISYDGNPKLGVMVLCLLF